MAELVLLVQGIRIHAGFYRDRANWLLDPGDTYVTDDKGRVVTEIDDADRLGALDDAGQFRSLRCLAEQAANDDVVAGWEREQLQAAAQERGRSQAEAGQRDALLALAAEMT